MVPFTGEKKNKLLGGGGGGGGDDDDESAVFQMHVTRACSQFEQSSVYHLYRFVNYNNVVIDDNIQSVQIKCCLYFLLLFFYNSNFDHLVMSSRYVIYDQQQYLVISSNFLRC